MQSDPSGFRMDRFPKLAEKVTAGFKQLLDAQKLAPAEGGAATKAALVAPPSAGLDVPPGASSSARPNGQSQRTSAIVSRTCTRKSSPTEMKLTGSVMIVSETGVVAASICCVESEFCRFTAMFCFLYGWCCGTG